MILYLYLLRRSCDEKKHHEIQVFNFFFSSLMRGLGRHWGEISSSSWGKETGEDVDGDGEDVDVNGEDVDVDGEDVDGDGEDVDSDGEDVDGDGEDVDGDDANLGSRVLAEALGCP